jgi:hypothetical protein
MSSFISLNTEHEIFNTTTVSHLDPSSSQGDALDAIITNGFTGPIGPTGPTALPESEQALLWKSTIFGWNFDNEPATIYLTDSLATLVVPTALTTLAGTAVFLDLEDQTTGGNLIPVGYRPARQQEIAVTFINNGLNECGSVTITTAGLVRILRCGGSTFSGLSGLPGISFSWSIV